MGVIKKANGNEKLEKLMQKFRQSEKSNLQYWASRSEKYSRENVIRACLAAGTTLEIAEKIFREIDGYVDQEMNMSDIRPLIFARLHAYDVHAARRFQPSEIFVRTSGEKFEIFRREKIAKSLIKETGLDEGIANEIAAEVETFLRTFKVNHVSSPLIREIVCVKLIEHGLEDARKNYSRLGIPVYDIQQMISRGISTDIKRENANLQHTPETINWILSGETLEQFSLLKLIPENLANPHISGDFHIHILSNIATRPNCLQHYPPLFFKAGLKADGTGRHTSVAGAPRHIGVAIQHCAKILLAAQTQMAGGQSIDCFNVWLAPFVRGLDDREIKQAAQEFIYELNQCFDYSNPIILINKDKEKIIPIGQFVENRLGGKEKAILNDEVYTYTFDDNLNFKKTKIIAVAKRNRKDGEKILEIKTRNGRAVKVTENHPLFVFRDGIKVIPAKEIKENDIVLTLKKTEHNQCINEINLINLLIEKLDEKTLDNIFITGFKNLTDEISNNTKKSFADLADSINISKREFRRWRESKRNSAPIRVVHSLIKKYLISTASLEFLKIKYGAGSFVCFPAILKFEPEFMRFLGYYVSEGHGVKDRNTLKISTAEKEIVQDLIKFSERYQIKMCKVSDNDYNFNSKILYTLIVKAFECGSLAHQKRVPNFLFHSNIQAITEFLKSYLSGDGGFWDSWAGCVTTSELLAHDLLLLFLKFGIVPSIKKRYKGKYRQQFLLGIFGKENLDLFSKIGFSISRKNERLEYYLNGFDDALTRTRAIIPLSSNSLNFIKSKKLFRYYNRDKLTSYNFKKLLALGLKQEISLLNEYVFWDVVSNVDICEICSENVYDIETEDHSFLAGFGFGFLAHNSYVARGGQVVFSNINLELGIPEWLRDVPAVGPKGEIKGVYGDYEEEALKFLREYIKIKLEGDHTGKQHMFPNDIFKIRSQNFTDSYNEELSLIHQFISKYGTPYIANGIPEWQTEQFNYMGCLASDTPLPYLNDNSLHFCSINEMAEKYFERFGSKKYGLSVYTEPQNLAVFSWNPEKNIIEKKKVLKIIKNPPAKLLKIKTTKGKSIKVTADHPFFRISRKTHYLKKAEEIPAGNLKAGDRILVPQKIPIFQSITNNIDASAELLGFFIGDGTILNPGKNPVIVFNFKADSDHLPYLKDVCKRLKVNLEIHKTYHSRDKADYVNCYIREKELCKKFLALYSGGKKIPDEIFNDSDSILGFLAGIINSDGYVRTVKKSKTKTIELLITTTLENVCNSLSLMFALLGLDYSIRKQEHPGKKCKLSAYRISLFGQNAEWLLSKIPLALRHKKKNFSDKIPSKEIKSVKILKIDAPLDSTKPVYDLEVEGNHTFVSGQGLFIHSNCRTRLDSKFAGPFGTLRTGNDVYITLNLPRIAYEAKGNDEIFFDILEARLKKMTEMLVLKHQLTDNSLHHDFILPFLTQKFDGEEYYQLKNTTKTFGYVGLTEAVKVHCGNHLHEDKKAQEFGIKVIQFIREYANRMTKETGLRFSVIASPAETCAARLVKLDFGKFGKNVIFSGTKEAPYYTNSHMVKMDANIPLAEKIKIEEAYHPLTNGGHILHIWLGEQSPSPESLLELTKKICRTNIGFFAYTRDYSVCNPCSNFEYGLKQSCSNCGSDDLSRYSRITGYYQKVEGWNPSKKQELKDRYRFDSYNCEIN